jgi:hypothetical protein
MPITFPFTLIAILFQVPICGLAREGMATVSQENKVSVPL